MKKGAKQQIPCVRLRWSRIWCGWSPIAAPRRRRASMFRTPFPWPVRSRSVFVHSKGFLSLFPVTACPKRGLSFFFLCLPLRHFFGVSFPPMVRVLSRLSPKGSIFFFFFFAPLEILERCPFFRSEFTPARHPRISLFSGFLFGVLCCFFPSLFSQFPPSPRFCVSLFLSRFCCF